MSNDIPSLSTDKDHPDRFLNCQFALEIAFQDIIARAVAAGWGERETCAALIELSENYVLGLNENDHVDAQVAALKKRP